MRRAILLWSGGKDSALTLLRLRAAKVKVAVLLTTFDAASRRVPMQEIPVAVIRRQALALGIPLALLALPFPCPNSEYEARFTGKLRSLARRFGCTAVAAGDIHLGDVLAYRRALVQRAGLRLLSPLWGLSGAAGVEAMLGSGIKARVCSIDPAHMPEHLLGATYDTQLIASLPPAVDPLGENGEFHTVVERMPGMREVKMFFGEAKYREPYRFLQLFHQ